LAPIAVLLACLPGESYLRCRIDGSVRTTCCCAEGEAPVNPGPIARPQDCCDRETTVTARPVVEARTGAIEPLAAPPLLAQVAPAVLAPPALRWERARPSHGPPRGGPPVVLLKHAFLI